jgi:hypothetical protein
MSEEQPKNDWDTNYFFFDHDAKRQYILQRMFEAEQLHFEMMVDKLEEGHSDFENWKETTKQLKEELDRLRYLFKLYGGTLGSELPTEE